MVFVSSCTTIDIVNSCNIDLDPLTFYRTYVAASKPCLIRGAISKWPALKKWNDSTKDHILEKCTDTTRCLQKCGRDRLVTCNYTPNGNGDHILNDHDKINSNDGPIFVKPEERQVEFGVAWDQLKQTEEHQHHQHLHGVPYLSIQNDSLREEFACLGQDIDIDGLPFLSKVFDKEALSAINLWIGDHRSVSSVHKDPFDNIYCVVKGTKTFTLLPPTDVRFLYEKAFPIGSYHLQTNSSKWQVRKEKGVVPWCQVDPAIPDLTRFPKFRHASPLHVEVKAGETLFLPALWYHRVGSKDGLTIAVNYWYDMNFGPLYTAYTLARRVSGLKPEHEYDESDLIVEGTKE